MAEIIPDEIKKQLQQACVIHQQAVSDYEKCVEFSKLMSDLLTQLEDAGFFTMADKVMGILLDCNPKIGAHCEKATVVGEKVKSFG